MNVKEEKIRSNFGYFGGISILYGVLFAFCLYRNWFGATFLLYAIVTVAVLCLFLRQVGEKIKSRTKLYFTAVISCGVSTCLTANQMIQFLNWACIMCLLILAMLDQLSDDSRWDILEYLGNGIILFFTAVRYCFLPVKESGTYLSKKEKKEHKNLRLAVAGIGLAAAALLIILPLLLASDLIFKGMFEALLSKLHFVNIFQMISTPVGMIFMALVGFTLIYAFFYASSHVEFRTERERKTTVFHPMTGIAFSAVIAAIYVFYCGIQIVYLFIGKGAGLPEGITYSQYARSGFWQLLFVAVINVLLVMICVWLFQKSKILNAVLTVISGCTFIMIASAAYRMLLYVQAYHLTFLRLVVLSFLTVLALIMGGVIVSIYRKGFSLVHYMVLVSVCCYLIFSFARPDYWIATYNVSHMEEISETNLDYMMYGLSLDAAPVIAEIEPDRIQPDQEDTTGNQQVQKAKLYRYFSMISENNTGLHFRKANYSRLHAKAIADDYLEQNKLDAAYYRFNPQ